MWDYSLIIDRYAVYCSSPVVKFVLNLFCYTGALSVAAAKGLARSQQVSICQKHISHGCTRNFENNDLNPKHYQFIRANILEWLESDLRAEFDIIRSTDLFNTKSTEQTLDIQRDHCALIDACARWLAPQIHLLLKQLRGSRLVIRLKSATWWRI